jgi:hypothetical protein
MIAQDLSLRTQPNKVENLKRYVVFSVFNVNLPWIIILDAMYNALELICDVILHYGHGVYALMYIAQLVFIMYLLVLIRRACFIGCVWLQCQVECTQYPGMWLTLMTCSGGFYGAKLVG